MRFDPTTIQFENELPSEWPDKKTRVFNLSIPFDKAWFKSEDKVLFVVDRVHTLDLKAKQLLGDKHIVKLYGNVLGYSWDYSEATKKLPIGFINYNFFKTYDIEDPDLRRLSEKLSTQRILNFIVRYKPSRVCVLGDRLVERLAAKMGIEDKYLANKRGEVFDAQVNGHSFKLTVAFGIEDQTLISSEGKASDDDNLVAEANLLGYAARTISSVWLNHRKYDLSHIKVRPIFVDTIPRFKKLMEKLETAVDEGRPVSIDTETMNLDVYDNAILSIQFSLDSKKGYFLPMSHKNSPFMGKELDYVKRRLRKWIMRQDTGNSYWIGQNLKFDLRVIKQYFGIPHIYYDVWDTIAGEWGLDEGVVALKGYGTPPYNLAQLFASYGNYFYYEASFSKQQRHTIASVPLDEDVQRYGCMDTQAVYAIHEMQLKRAEWQEFNGKPYAPYYKRFILKLMSPIVHTMSLMEHRGTTLDLKYLMSQMAPNSDINQLIKQVQTEFLAFDTVKQLNARLMKEHGVPTKSLFGTVSQTMFDISKVAHKHALFFEVLELEPIVYGKDGETPGIGKAFQNAYKDVPEVALLTKLNKVQKLKSSYVDAFYRHVGHSSDGRQDSRLRAGYGYQDVVTGRANSFNPSLQQIPEHGEFAKIIKRMFIAPEGKLVIKQDYCLSGSSLIATTDGIIRLDSLSANLLLNKPVPINYKILGANGIAKSAYVVYKGEKPTLRVTAKSGNYITCTKDHRILILRNSKLLYVQASDCVLGDYVCIPSTPCTRDTPLKLGLPDAMVLNSNNTSGYVGVHRDKNTYYANIKHNNTTHTIRNNFRTAEEAHFARLEYCKEHGINPMNSSRVNVMKPDIMTPELAYILGCIVADGYITSHARYNVVHFFGCDRKFLERFVACVYSVFGYSATIELGQKKGSETIYKGNIIRLNSDLFTIRIRGQTIISWMLHLGVYSQYGRKNDKTQSHYQHVPWSVLQADSESQMAFLAAYLEADGVVNNARHCLQWTSTSFKIMTGIRAILNAHGLMSSITGLDGATKTLNLGRHSSQILWEKLEKYMVTKKLEPYKVMRSDRLGRLPYDYYVDESIVDREFYFSPIVQIKDAKFTKVYDISMSSGEDPSFTANGIVVHNCAHEVRCWGLISQDKSVGSAFQVGKNAKIKYRLDPTEDNYKLAQTVGDIHKVNYSYFTQTPVDKVTKEQRQESKGMVFGSIYGMSTQTLAANLEKPLKYVENLLKTFFSKFPKASKWLTWTREFSKQTLYTYSPLYRRRNLFGYLVGNRTIDGAMERRAANSPVQGMGSDLGFIGASIFTKLIYEAQEELGIIDSSTEISMCPIGLNVMVHDSMELESPYQYIPLVVHIMEYSTTVGVRDYVKRHFGLKFVVGLEVDYNIGAASSSLKDWDYTPQGLMDCIRKGLEYQRDEIGYNVDVDREMKKIEKAVPKYQHILDRYPLDLEIIEP